jgi:hypothetical protein
MEGRKATPRTTPFVQTGASQGKVRRNSEVRQSVPIAHEFVHNNTFRSTQSMAMEEGQPLGMGVREPGCEQTRKDDPGRLYPSP